MKALQGSLCCPKFRSIWQRRSVSCYEAICDSIFFATYSSRCKGSRDAADEVLSNWYRFVDARPNLPLPNEPHWRLQRLPLTSVLGAHLDGAFSPRSQAIGAHSWAVATCLTSIYLWTKRSSFYLRSSL